MSLSGLLNKIVLKIYCGQSQLKGHQLHTTAMTRSDVAFQLTVRSEVVQLFKQKKTFSVFA